MLGSTMLFLYLRLKRKKKKIPHFPSLKQRKYMHVHWKYKMLIDKIWHKAYRFWHVIDLDFHPRLSTHSTPRIELSEVKSSCEKIRKKPPQTLHMPSSHSKQFLTSNVHILVISKQFTHHLISQFLLVFSTGAFLFTLARGLICLQGWMKDVAKVVQGIGF